MNHPSRRKIILVVGINIIVWAGLVWLNLTLGLKVSFGLFFAIPVLLAAWYLGRGWGLVFAFTSGSLKHAMEMFILHEYTIHSYRYWDLFSSLLALSAISLVASWSKALVERERLLNRELQQAIEQIKVLEGMLPICAWCKKVRDDQGLWEKVEDYVSKHSNTTWTHSICPECLKKVKEEELS